MKSEAKARAIIICAGEASRWRNHRGVPKHLVVIEGERILDRMVRLLKARGVDDIHVVVKAAVPAYDVPGATQFPASLDSKNGDADKFLSSKALWNKSGRT